MSANYKEVAKGLPGEEAQRYATGIDLVGNFVDSLQRKGLLPKRFAKAVGADATSARSRKDLPLRLEPIPFEIEIPTVSVEDYVKTRRAVEAAIPDVFITSIRTVSIEDLLAEDLNRGERRFNHEWVNGSKTMRATFPPEMEVFINPRAVRIEGSDSLSTDAQKTKIAEAAASLKEQLPEAVRGFVNLHMVDPSTMSQLEDAWMDAGNGVLLADYFARTDVQTVRGHVAYVGRYVPAGRRNVYDWDRDLGRDNVFAVPVGVLPRKLIA